METREEQHVNVGKVRVKRKDKEIKYVFLIDSIGLYPQSAVTLYIYRVEKTYPSRIPVYRSKSIKFPNCTRTPHGPVRPVGSCQTGYREQTHQTVWAHQSDRLVPILVVNISLPHCLHEKISTTR